MRIRVLCYKTDGNTLTDKWETCTAKSGDIYITEEDSNGMQDLILKYGDVYVNEGTYKAERLKEVTLADFMEHHTNYMKNIEEGTGHANFLQIELFKRLGRDTAPLIERRAQHLMRMTAKRVDEQLEREKESREAAEAEETRIRAQFDKFKNNEHISFDDFLQLCRKFKIEMHPRTVGMINDLRGGGISRDSINTYGELKRRDFVKVFAAARELFKYEIATIENPIV